MIDGKRRHWGAFAWGPYPDGPYRPEHWPDWARDEIITIVDIRFGWTDWLLILIGRAVTVKVQTVVERPPGRCASQSSTWAHRIRWPWSRQPGGYAEIAETERV